MGFNRWPVDHSNALLLGFKAGDTCEKIAQTINETFGTSYTRSAIWSRALRLNVDAPNPVHFWPDEHKQKLSELYNEDNGLSFAKMAARINAAFGWDYSREAVIGQARRMKLTGKREPDSDRQPSTRERKPRMVRTKAPDMAQPPLRCVEIEPHNITLDELEPGDCRYIAGEDYLFCGHPQYVYVMDGAKRTSSYCRQHHELTRTTGLKLSPAEHARRRAQGAKNFINSKNAWRVGGFA